ncbi:hypothetical protein Tdes44962_MAKER02495 [Teratosphaeria destructans]|uniref:Uncharacterized protein n=1 Tax=Teratosphaeria destructans TaxID=418781 RepID=A0A9W7STN4_9PEZI|nr:hypothetical protein Tdes44962_MAKER02495 [Teratosphaeria destructans]
MEQPVMSVSLITTTLLILARQPILLMHIPSLTLLNASTSKCLSHITLSHQLRQKSHQHPLDPHLNHTRQLSIQYIHRLVVKGLPLGSTRMPVLLARTGSRRVEAVRTRNVVSVRQCFKDVLDF